MSTSSRLWQWQGSWLGIVHLRPLRGSVFSADSLPASQELSASIDSLPRVAVDLTTMLPGGIVGGAKVLTLELIRRLAPHYDLLLLTSEANDAEVSAYTNSEIARLRALPDGSLGPVGSEPASRSPGRARIDAVKRLARRLSAMHLGPINRMLQWVNLAPALRERGVQLLFCPFTTSGYAGDGVPVVSIAYDLQHLDYPQFFTPREIWGRNAQLRWLERSADRIVCLSNHARHRFLRELDVPSSHVRVAPCAIHDRLLSATPVPIQHVRDRVGLTREYVLYPANTWPHKNHRLLLLAFAILRSKHSDLDVDLVLTGTTVSSADTLKHLTAALNLEDRVHWAGHCTDSELAALYRGSRMVVFPSLYEGFGIPLLEAMALDRPVACSTSSSLPEVGGDAVRYFDPRRPAEIAAAMAEILTRPEVEAELVARGKARLTAFDADLATDLYREVFDEVLRERIRVKDGVSGVFGDGWTGGAIKLAQRGGHDRTAEIELEVPAWRPRGGVYVYLKGSAGRWFKGWRVPRGNRRTLRLELPRDPGHLTLAVTPLFRPSDHGVAGDVRQLGCLCASVRFHDSSGPGPNLVMDGEGR